MKKITTYLLIILFIVYITSCSNNPDPRLKKIKTPCWEKTDLEMEKIKTGEHIYGNGRIITYTHSIETKTKIPFYDEKLPLKFNAGYPPGMTPGNSYSIAKPIFYEFKDFTTYYIYDGPLILGSQTYGKNGKLLAEVKSVNFYIINEDQQGIEIEELQYNDSGELVFSCNGQIDYSGYKTKETNKIGRKINNYYFIWPVP